MKKRVNCLLAITIVVAVLWGPGIRPAHASAFGASTTAVGTWTGLVLVSATAAYIAWLYRPGAPPVDWAPKGPGGWYLGLYSGVSFIPTNDWHFIRSESTFNNPIPYPTTAQNIGWGTSPAFGWKLGYYFHKAPHFGIEGDASFSWPGIHDQVVKLRTPFPPNNVIPGNKALFSGQSIFQWTLALHFMGRLGFIKDDEVPFGRIQPYVGLGPSFTVLKGHWDTGKNFGLDVPVGVRYMLRKNLSLFTEFKYNWQYVGKLEHTPLKQLPPGFHNQRGVGAFDLTMLTWAAGVCVHFW